MRRFLVKYTASFHGAGKNDKDSIENGQYAVNDYNMNTEVISIQLPEIMAIMMIYELVFQVNWTRLEQRQFRLMMLG